MLQGLPDPRLELPVTSSLGVGADLETAGAPASCHPRGVVSYALLVGVAIVSRKQRQQVRGQRR